VCVCVCVCVCACVCARAMILCYKLPEMSHPPHIRFLGKFLTYPFYFKLIPKELFRCPVVTAKPSVQPLDLTTIFRNACGFDNAQ
jgi:hypothetical protein